MSEKEKQEIFMQLLSPILKELQRFTRAISKDREEAKDLSQETILRGFYNFEKLNDLSKFKGYIFTIARNLNSRHQWRRGFFGIFNNDYAENIKSNHSNPEMLYDVEVLYQTLNKLPLKQREAIALFDISGFSLEEIKEMQGGTLSGVKSRLKRGRERLKEMMTKEKNISQSLKKIEYDSEINKLEFAGELIQN